MSDFTRRDFLAAAAAASAGTVAWPGVAPCGEIRVTGKPVPMLHVSDLFRPHNDPDDHWDLACVYSLAWQRHVDLRGILIDYPPPQTHTDPDILSVAQLNYLTGKAVPVVIGAPRWVDSADAGRPENDLALRGVRALLGMLQHSDEPIVINILGSCRDVALAGSLAPELFAQKCKAIYLNAGSGTPDPEKAAKLEWNVSLDPRAYSKMFTLPCPLYWMPCFEELGRDASQSSTPPQYGTYYRFRQSEILPQLSDEMQKFFAYLFKHGRYEEQRATKDDIQPDWLRYLVAPKDAGLLERANAMDRNMWCTGGFLHAVGLTVTRSGEIVPIQEAQDPVFTFDPVDVTCSPDGVTAWQPATASPPRYIFHVRDAQQYPAAMTAALKTLLCELPTRDGAHR